MSKELEALEDIILYLNASEPKGLYFENIEIIKNALKAFEIIRKYPRCSLQRYIGFNEFFENGYELTQEHLFIHDIPCSVEEYELLKEVLL